jgi:two-component sensor histidine kinase
MVTKELVHTINNQLAIVMSRADLLDGSAGDLKTRKNCEAIRKAVHNINTLLGDLVVASRVVGSSVTEANR